MRIQHLDPSAKEDLLRDLLKRSRTSTAPMRRRWPRSLKK